MWTPDVFGQTEIMIWSWPSKLLLRLSTRFLECVCGNLSPFSRNSDDYRNQAPIMDEKTWLARDVPVHPKGSQWGWGQLNFSVGTAFHKVAFSTRSGLYPSDCHIAKHDLALQTCFCCSRVQWWCDLHHSRWHLALHKVIFRMCAAARPWKPVSRSSWYTVPVLMLLPEVVWNSTLL